MTTRTTKMKTNTELKSSALWTMLYAFLLGCIGAALTTSTNEVVVLGGHIIVYINIFTAGFSFGRYVVYANS